MKFFAVFIVACFVAPSIVLAQTTAKSCSNTLGSGVVDLYSNATGPCSQQVACETAYNSCLGSGSSLNCSLATQCIAARITCLNAAASNTSSCLGLNNLQLSLLKLAAGFQLYNESAAYSSCSIASCRWLNSTFSGAGGECSYDVDSLCVSPVNSIMTLLLLGNFTAIMSDLSKRTIFANAVLRDLSRVFRVPFKVLRMFLAGSRRQGTRVLVFEVQAVGVSPSNSAFLAALATFSPNPVASLTEASAAYTSYTGGTLQFLNVGLGTSSAAFSTFQIPTTTPSSTANPSTTRVPSTQVNSQAPMTPAPFLASSDAAKGAGVPLLTLLLAALLLA